MSKSYDSAHHDTCVKGMATILWGSSWADHVEEHRCCRLSGAKIEEVMPPIPPEAYAMAERALGHIEQACGMSWPCLFAAAWRADFADGRRGINMPSGEPRPEDYTSELAGRFGECLAWMAMGAGVSWFDDHAFFIELDEVPYCADMVEGELRQLADSGCSLAGRKQCPSCSGYLDEEGCCVDHCVAKL